LGESACGAILAAGPDLENLRQKPSEIFQSHFEASNDLFSGPGACSGERFHVLHFGTFRTVRQVPQSEFVCESCASRKFTCRVDHHCTGGCHVNPRYSSIWGQPREDLKEYSRGSKTLSQLRVEEVKTLPLAGYRTMLNTRPRGGEGGSIP